MLRIMPLLLWGSLILRLRMQVFVRILGWDLPGFVGLLPLPRLVGLRLMIRLLSLLSLLSLGLPIPWLLMLSLGLRLRLPLRLSLRLNLGLRLPLRFSLCQGF